MAKRANQIIVNLMRVMLKEAGLPNKFGVEAAEIDAYLRNITLNNLNLSKTDTQRLGRRIIKVKQKA